MSGNIMLLAPEDTFLATFNDLTPEGVRIGWVDSTQSLDQQAAQLNDTVVIIATPSDIPAELVGRCPRLKLVQVVSAGTNRINIQALGELGVRVANNGGGNAVAVAEHTLALMVGVYRMLQLQIQAVKSRKWQDNIRTVWGLSSHEIAGKTVGIVGFGRIGQQVARRLLGWECDVIYFDIFKPPAEVERELKVTGVSLDALLRTADIVSLHMPLTKRTTGIISDREFDMMKPSSVLINTCRGPVVDEAALIRALKAGKIASAGLDVLEREPTPVDNPLLDMDNVLVTPHLAALPEESREKSRAFAVFNALKVLAGEEPESVVLPD